MLGIFQYFQFDSFDQQYSGLADFFNALKVKVIDPTWRWTISLILVFGQGRLEADWLVGWAPTCAPSLAGPARAGSSENSFGRARPARHQHHQSCNAHFCSNLFSLYICTFVFRKQMTWMYTTLCKYECMILSHDISKILTACRMLLDSSAPNESQDPQLSNGVYVAANLKSQLV